MGRNLESSRAIGRGWDEMSVDYQSSSEISTCDIHYSPFGPGEAELGLIGEISGKDILELGCGAAQNCIAADRQGANRVVGVDISTKQLEAALNLRNKTKSSKMFLFKLFAPCSFFKFVYPFSDLCLFDYIVSKVT